MKFHEELNPKIWTKMREKRIGGKTNYYLKPEVRDKLNQISDAFIEYLDIPEKAILDIRITGSSANYNYTPHSDLDLHIIVDYDKVHKDCPIVEGYLWSMKSAFNKDHDISIYGIPVELYAEDSRVEAISNGVYSLLNNKWLKIPQKIKPTSNDAAVEAKFNELAEAVDKCDDSEVAKELQDKIYQMRKTGLSQEGEFSTENLAFKKLRDIGALERLKAMKKEKIDKELSLESYKKSDDDLTNFYIIIDGDYNWLEEYGTFKSSKAAQEWLDKNGEEDWMYSRLTKGEMKDLGIDEFGYVNESRKEDKQLSLESYFDNNNMSEYYDEEDDTDSSEEMHKTDYVIRFRTMQGQIKKLFLSIITDEYDPSYNEVINTTSDRQLGLFDTLKQAKDCIKNTAEKCARNNGYTIISIDNLGNDDEYYLKRNNYESLNNWDTSKLSIKELNLKVEKLLENFN